MDSLPTNSRDKKTNIFSSSKVGATLFIGLLLALCPRPAGAATTTVTVGDGGFFFFPSSVTIDAGDTVEWTWSAGGHSSTSGTPGQPSGFWDSGILNQGATFSHTFPAAGSFPYFCSPHGLCCGMVGSVTVIGTDPFAYSDTRPDRPGASPEYFHPCRSAHRGSSPNRRFHCHRDRPETCYLAGDWSLAGEHGVSNPLADPVMELHASDGSLITSNDNWRGP